MTLSGNRLMLASWPGRPREVWPYQVFRTVSNLRNGPASFKLAGFFELGRVLLLGVRGFCSLAVSLSRNLLRSKAQVVKRRHQKEPGLGISERQDLDFASVCWDDQSAGGNTASGKKTLST